MACVAPRSHGGDAGGSPTRRPTRPMSGRDRKLPGGGSTSRRSANSTFGSDVMTRDEITQLLRQEQQENELYKKQAEEAQQRAYLAALKADAAYSGIVNFQSLLGQFFTHYNPHMSQNPQHDLNTHNFEDEEGDQESAKEEVEAKDEE